MGAAPWPCSRHRMNQADDRLVPAGLPTAVPDPRRRHRWLRRAGAASYSSRLGLGLAGSICYGSIDFSGRDLLGLISSLFKGGEDLSLMLVTESFQSYLQLYAGLPV